MPHSIGHRFADAWSSGDPDRFAQLFTQACVYEDLPLGVTARGRIEIANHLRNWLQSSSDIHMQLLSETADGDRVALEWLYTGTHDGPFQGLPPTGHRFRFRGASVFELEGTMINACADYWDMGYLLRVLGEDLVRAKNRDGI